MRTLFDSATSSAPAQFRPRGYQEEAHDKMLRSLRSHGASLGHAATGLGKTVMFSHLAKHYLETGRVLVIVHRDELAKQAKRKLASVTGASVGIEMGDMRHDDFGKPDIVVASVQTLRSSKRLKQFQQDHFGLVITDECHHATATSYRKVYDYFRAGVKTPHAGYTATPKRSDDVGLKAVYADVAFSYDLAYGEEQGWLVPIRQSTFYIDDLDLSDVRTVGGDLNGEQLSALLEQDGVAMKMASVLHQEAAGRKSICFTQSVGQCRIIEEYLNDIEPGYARHVVGATCKRERPRIVSEFAGGSFRSLVNVGVATEGFDDPGVMVIGMMRPTESRVVYEQAVGRGVRVDCPVDSVASAAERKAMIAASSKPYCYVVDFVGNAGKHNLITPFHLLEGDDPPEVIALAQKMAEPGEGLKETLSKARKTWEEQEDERRRREKEQEERDRVKAKMKVRIIPTARYRKEVIDPHSVFDINPHAVRVHERGREITTGMMRLIQKNSIDTRGLSMSEGRQIIESMPPIPEQVKFMQAAGIEYTDSTTYPQAKKLIKDWQESRGGGEWKEW